jgi:hypothetical protein
MVADPRRMGHEAIFFHDADGFDPGAHGQRVASKRGAVVARLEDVGGFGASDDCANRHRRFRAPAARTPEG